MMRITRFATLFALPLIFAASGLALAQQPVAPAVPAAADKTLEETPAAAADAPSAGAPAAAEVVEDRIAPEVVPPANPVPTSAAPIAAAASADSYRSPQRVMCEAEMRKDAFWHAELADQLRARIHQEDANLMLVNREHVVYAYGALWGITALFVAFMWTRQQRLNAEIAALRSKVAKAVSDDA